MKDAEKIISTAPCQTAIFALTHRPDPRIDFLIKEETSFINSLIASKIFIRARLFIRNNVAVLLTMFQIGIDNPHVYKVFWDYHIEGGRGRFAFELISNQEDIAFHLYGDSKTIEKSILTANSFKNFFKAAIKKIEILPAWNSEQYEKEKEEILKTYPTIQALWDAIK